MSDPGEQLYGQEPEAHLLSAFASWLEHRSVIDVGAERGAFTEAMVRAGIDEVHAFEPEPDNAAALRARFAGDRRVTVHELAISDADGRRDLRRSVDPAGLPVTYGHTFLDRPDAAEIGWAETVSVVTRSLGSLVGSGEIPGRVGMLKVDTEGHDLAVIEGMGALECDVVMVEHWRDLPRSLGPCPWTAEQMTRALAPRGFSHFAFVYHRAEFVIVKWDDGDVAPGFMGNLVFLHDRVLPRALTDVLHCATQLSIAAVEVGEMYMHAARERMAVIEQFDS